MTPLILDVTPPPPSEREILRYAAAKEGDPILSQVLAECLSEAEKVISYRFLVCRLSVKVTGNLCDFGVFSLSSAALARYFDGVEETYLLAATLGANFDRLLQKYSALRPSYALMLQAIGAERIEALCDAFSPEGEKLKPRFSPGYGDLSLEAQQAIFSFLKPETKIGLTLHESFMMSPSKSVTAFAAVKKD